MRFLPPACRGWNSVPHGATRAYSVQGMVGLVRLILLPVLLVTSVLRQEGNALERHASPIVKAVQSARKSVVNIQGQKTVPGVPVSGSVAASREVSGMGTGVVIDSRGYLLTNHHVVAGVRRINVILDDGDKLIAHLVAHDESTDLAIVKVRVPQPMQVISIGTSSDLMTGETVIALGNAYGYEHTVTRGIISALHRDVQVTDTQSYDDLIQTDASINPGNSGGPLLNVNGEMIGINVAVRAGAQGIGFAIPVDKVLEIAANLLSINNLEKRIHGLSTRPAETVGGPLLVYRVKSQSPAGKGGFKVGDRITSIASTPVTRPLDLERALLGRRSGEPVSVDVVRNGRRKVLSLTLGRRSKARPGVVRSLTGQGNPPSRNERSWEVLGMDLNEEPEETFAVGSSRYRGGMRVVGVRDGGPAARQGILAGDILVGMHRWETTTSQDVDYIVRRAKMGDLGSVKFYVLRGEDTLYGQMNVANQARRHAGTVR
jgi:serine protease Do